MKVYKITMEDGGQPLILSDLKALDDLIGSVEYDEVGSKYQIEVIDMPKEEFDNLPEWGGF